MIKLRLLPERKWDNATSLPSLNPIDEYHLREGQSTLIFSEYELITKRRSFREFIKNPFRHGARDRETDQRGYAGAISLNLVRKEGEAPIATIEGFSVRSGKPESLYATALIVGVSVITKAQGVTLGSGKEHIAAAVDAAWTDLHEHGQTTFALDQGFRIVPPNPPQGSAPDGPPMDALHG